MKTGVYILKSLKNQRHYIGSTKDIDRRLAQHELGKVKATKNILPLELVAFLPCGTPTDARRAEYKLKNYKRKDIIELVIRDKKFPWEHVRA
ncbi:MAG: GIY-YIG nuclease family protein [Candidatus Colwellbacteria bacterium]|nr:GIY-YIG nuclease family protein [Candidatus Colwellbacteria bacterium]